MAPNQIPEEEIGKGPEKIPIPPANAGWSMFIRSEIVEFLVLPNEFNPQGTKSFTVPARVY